MLIHKALSSEVSIFALPLFVATESPQPNLVSDNMDICLIERYGYALKSVRDISRICEEEMRESNHMRDITHLYPTFAINLDVLKQNFIEIRPNIHLTRSQPYPLATVTLTRSLPVVVLADMFTFVHINTQRLRQDGSYFADGIFNFKYRISLQYTPYGIIGNKPALVRENA